jgi:tetratricopeptide (TPR) repeat protein
MLRTALASGRGKILTVLIITILLGVSWWLWFRPLPIAYVAVVKPELEEGIPQEFDDILRLSIESEVGRYRKTHILRAREIDAVEGGSEAIARQLGANEIVSSRVSPDGADFRVELVRETIDFDNKDKFISKKRSVTFPAPDFETPSTLVGLVRARLNDFYRDRRKLLSRSPAGDYVALARVWDRLGRPGVDYDELLVELEAIRESGKAPIEAYQLEASISRYLYQVSCDENYLKHARKVLEQAPGDPRLLLTGIEVEQAAGEDDRVQALLAAAEESIPNHPYLWNYRAKAIEDTNISKAIEIVSQARETVFSLNMLARLEIKDGLLEDAREHIEKAISIDPDSVFVIKRYAELELVCGNSEKAEALFSYLLEKNPNHHSYRVNIAVIHLLTGRLRSAVSHLEHAQEAGYRKPIVLHAIGDAYALLGERERAEDHYSQVVETTETSDNPQEIAFRAQAFAKLGLATEALEALNRVQAKAPMSPEMLFYSSVVHAVLGDMATAEEMAKQSVSGGMGEQWFRLPWFDGIAIEGYAAGVKDTRERLRAGAEKIRDHDTDIRSVEERCSAIHRLLIKGEVEQAADEIDAVLSEVEGRASTNFDIAVAFGVMVIVGITLSVFCIVFIIKGKKRYTDRIERSRQKAEEYIKSVRDDLEKIKTLETLRNVMKLELSLVTELMPDIRIAMNRAAFCVKNNVAMNDTLKEINTALSAVNEVMEIVSELEASTGPEAGASEQSIL